VRVATTGGRDAVGCEGYDGIAELPGAVTRGVVTCPACGLKDGGYEWAPPALFGNYIYVSTKITLDSGFVLIYY
jgi:hypothetical protein